MSAPQSPGAFSSHSERIILHRNYLRSQLREQFLREKHDAARTSLARDQLRSKEAQLVADWLFIHGIAYRCFVSAGSQSNNFTCDFMLTQGERAVYFDLVVVDKSGSSIYGPIYLRGYARRCKVAREAGINYFQMPSFV